MTGWLVLPGELQLAVAREAVAGLGDLVQLCHSHPGLVDAPLLSAQGLWRHIYAQTWTLETGARPRADDCTWHQRVLRAVQADVNQVARINEMEREMADFSKCGISSGPALVTRAFWARNISNRAGVCKQKIKWPCRRLLQRPRVPRLLRVWQEDWGILCGDRTAAERRLRQCGLSVDRWGAIVPQHGTLWWSVVRRAQGVERLERHNCAAVDALQRQLENLYVRQ